MSLYSKKYVWTSVLVIDSSFQMSVKLRYLFQDMHLETLGLFPPCIRTTRSLYRSFCNMSTDCVLLFYLTWIPVCKVVSCLVIFIIDTVLSIYLKLSLRGGLFTFRFKTSTPYLLSVYLDLLTYVNMFP